MKGIDGKYYELIETFVEVSADGLSFTSGGTIIFSKAFDNVPIVTIVPPLGSVDLDNQVGLMWEVDTISTTQCTISPAGIGLASNWREKSLKIAVFVHEQL